eukprot:Gb_07251 [translate_table: standard]
MRQLIGEFILLFNVDYTDFGSEFYGVGKGHLTRPTGPSHSGGDCTDSRPSHGDRSRIPRYVSNDKVYHMSVEDLRSLYFECRDYIHGTDYVDFAYGMEHGQASSFLKSSVATAYERVGGAGPSREFEEPRVDLMFDLTQRWPSYTGPETVQIKHSEQPSVDLPSCTATPEATTCLDMAPVVSQTHDSMTSPLSVEVTTCPDTTPMASVPESVLGSQTHDPTTSPLDGHCVIGRQSRQTDEDLEDGDRRQRLRHKIDTEDIVPPRDSSDHRDLHSFPTRRDRLVLPLCNDFIVLSSPINLLLWSLVGY